MHPPRVSLLAQVLSFPKRESAFEPRHPEGNWLSNTFLVQLFPKKVPQGQRHTRFPHFLWCSFLSKERCLGDPGTKKRKEIFFIKLYSFTLLYTQYPPFLPSTSILPNISSILSASLCPPCLFLTTICRLPPSLRCSYAPSISL